MNKKKIYSDYIKKIKLLKNITINFTMKVIQKFQIRI